MVFFLCVCVCVWIDTALYFKPSLRWVLQGVSKRHAEKHLLTDELLHRALPYCLCWRTAWPRWGTVSVYIFPVLITTSHINTPWSPTAIRYLLICKSAYYSTSGWRSATCRTPVISSRCVLLQPRRQQALADLSWGLIYVPVMIMPAGDPYFINQMCSSHIPSNEQGCSVGVVNSSSIFFVRVQN